MKIKETENIYRQDRLSLSLSLGVPWIWAWTDASPVDLWVAESIMVLVSSLFCFILFKLEEKTMWETHKAENLYKVGI